MMYEGGSMRREAIITNIRDKIVRETSGGRGLYKVGRVSGRKKEERSVVDGAIKK